MLQQTDRQDPEAVRVAETKEATGSEATMEATQEATIETTQ